MEFAVVLMTILTTASGLNIKRSTGMTRPISFIAPLVDVVHLQAMRLLTIGTSANSMKDSTLSLLINHRKIRT